MLQLSICFIVNPRSGRARRLLPRVRAFAAEMAAELRLTESAGHASELARAALAAGCTRIIAVGGDGTLNEVGRVLIDTPAVLGLVPCGSGDGLGRHLGIHPVDAAFKTLRQGRVRRIDTGFVEGRPFFTTAGCGFEAEVSARFNTPGQRGFFGYLLRTARALSSSRPEHYTIEHDGQSTEFRAFTIAVTNGDQYGNNARIAPGARIDDGLLDLTAVGALSAWNAAPLAVRLFAGNLAESRDVLRRRSARFVIERRAAGPIHVDGEVFSAGPRLEFSVRPASLQILAPASL